MGEAAKIEVLDDGRAVDLHRHVAARPGPRHVVVDDRQRPDGHPDRPHRARVGRHRPACPPAAARWARARCSRAAPPSTRRPSSSSRRPRSSPPRRWRRRRPTSCSTSTPARSTSPARRAVVQVVGRAGGARRRSDGEPLLIDTRFEAGSPTFPFGAHVAVVEVDTETGQVRLVRHVACDDAGRVINPLLLEGQIHGGIAQGAAQALLEEVRYDEDGNPITSNLADYAMISAAELPSFEVVHMETPTPVNPLGAKGIGESGTIGSTPAVQSAVVDAVSPPRRPPHRHAGHRRARLAGDPGRLLTASVLRNRPDRAGSATDGTRWTGLTRRLAERRAIVAPMLSYLDPGTGSMIAAAFAGGVAGFGVLLRMYWPPCARGLLQEAPRPRPRRPRPSSSAMPTPTSVDADVPIAKPTPVRSATRCRGSSSTTTACGAACPRRRSPTTRRSPRPASSGTPRPRRHRRHRARRRTTAAAAGRVGRRAAPRAHRRPLVPVRVAVRDAPRRRPAAAGLTRGALAEG